MDEKNIFQQALDNFTFDVASGGAIAHLADLGYTPREIQGMLDFPTSYERVQEAVWKHLLEKRVIVEERSQFWKKQEKVSFVTEYDAYGRKSFRRVVEYLENKTPAGEPKTLRTVTYHPCTHGPFASFLKEYCCRENEDANAKNAYVSCDFGLRMKREPEAYEVFLKPLAESQRLYMEGIPWERKEVWHLLDQRMAGILTTLYGQSAYHGTILLLEKEEQVIF